MPNDNSDIDRAQRTADNALVAAQSASSDIRAHQAECVMFRKAIAATLEEIKENQKEQKENQREQRAMDKKIWFSAISGLIAVVGMFIMKYVLPALPIAGVQ